MLKNAAFNSVRLIYASEIHGCKWIVEIHPKWRVEIYPRNQNYCNKRQNSPPYLILCCLEPGTHKLLSLCNNTPPTPDIFNLPPLGKTNVRFLSRALRSITFHDITFYDFFLLRAFNFESLGKLRQWYNSVPFALFENWQNFCPRRKNAFWIIARAIQLQLAEKEEDFPGGGSLERDLHKGFSWTISSWGKLKPFFFSSLKKKS